MEALGACPGNILGVGSVSQSVDLGRSNNPNTTPTKDYEMCEWWFTSAVSREDVLTSANPQKCARV